MKRIKGMFVLTFYSSGTVFAAAFLLWAVCAFFCGVAASRANSSHFLMSDRITPFIIFAAGIFLFSRHCGMCQAVSASGFKQGTSAAFAGMIMSSVLAAADIAVYMFLPNKSVWQDSKTLLVDHSVNGEALRIAVKSSDADFAAEKEFCDSLGRVTGSVPAELCHLLLRTAVIYYGLFMLGYILSGSVRSCVKKRHIICAICAVEYVVLMAFLAVLHEKVYGMAEDIVGVFLKAGAAVFFTFPLTYPMGQFMIDRSAIKDVGKELALILPITAAAMALHIFIIARLRPEPKRIKRR